MNAPRLRRGLFGYSARSVRLSLAARERELSESSGRAAAAEQRADALTQRTQAAEARCAELDAELEVAARSAQEARATLAARDGLLDELRVELATSRRLFLRQVAHGRSLEATVEDLAAKLWQARAESAEGATPGEGSEPLVVLPDLEAQAERSNGHPPAARPV